jgi:phosphoribosylglycinamide formyltransferase-1
MKRVAIFASGNGSNFEAIVRYFEGKDVEFICVTDKQDSYVRERAKKLGVRDFFVPFKETEKFLSENGFDLIVLAGYMRILPPNVLALARFVNIHPSLLRNLKA